MPIDPLPLTQSAPRRAVPATEVVLLDIAPILGVAEGGCALACGVVVCAFHRIAGVTQRGLAEACGVPFPPREGMQLRALAKGLALHGVASRPVGQVSVEMLRTAILSGTPVIGGHAVDAGKSTGHAVVISGWIALPGRPPLVAVCDPNFSFPLLIEATTMAASARSALLIAGRRA